MTEEEVLDAIIKAITMIENAPQQHLTDYSIYDALCQARDYIITEQ